MTMWEHGFGSIQVDFGGIEMAWSAIPKTVSMAGCFTKKTIWWENSSVWSMIPGRYSMPFSTSWLITVLKISFCSLKLVTSSKMFLEVFLKLIPNNFSSSFRIIS